eukprot:Awhi_evm1s9466
MNQASNNRGFCVITGLATCKAEHTLSQAEAALICKEKLAKEDNIEGIKKEKFIDAVYNNTRIATRNLVIPPDSTPEELKVHQSIPNPYGNNDVERKSIGGNPLKVEKVDSGLNHSIFPISPPKSPLLNCMHMVSKEKNMLPWSGKTIDQLQLDERFNLFEHYSKTLIINASKRALKKANVDPKEIGEVVFVTNTGFHAPHLQQPLFEEVGISEDAILNNLMGMGCGGGISGLRLGYEHCLANPDRIVLLVVVDISSVHTTLSEDDLQDSWSVLNEYGNMLAPSVMYVMEKLLERLEPSRSFSECNQSPEPEHGVAISFSPGLRVE